MSEIGLEGALAEVGSSLVDNSLDPKWVEKMESRLDKSKVVHTAEMAVKLATRVGELKQTGRAEITLTDLVPSVIEMGLHFDRGLEGSSDEDNAKRLLRVIENDVSSGLQSMALLMDRSDPRFKELFELARSVKNEEAGLDIVLGAVLLPHCFGEKTPEFAIQQFGVPPSHVTEQMVDNVIRAGKEYLSK